jgi:hypothetical protein
MPNAELLVNPLARNANSVHSEISLGEKSLTTPFFGAKLPEAIDFESLLAESKMSYNPQALCFELPTAVRILQARNAQAKQLTLSLERRNPYLEAMLRSAFLVIDPRPELFYYNLPGRQQIFRQSSFPSKIRDVLADVDADSHTRKWLELRQKRLDLALVDWAFSVQKRLGSDLILPLCPILTGESLSDMARLLWSLNMRCRNAVLELSESYPAFYLPFHYKMLDHRETIDTLGNIVEAAAPFQRVFVLKVVWYSGVRRVEQRKRLGHLLDRIDAIKSSQRDGFVVFMVDAGPEGYPLLFNGVDGYFEPLSGHVGYVKASRVDSEAEMYGSYLNPRTREMLRWEELVSTARENQGYLPCDCKVCEAWHGKILHELIDGKVWNRDRRVHHFNVRSAEIQNNLIPAIERGQVHEEWTRLIDAGDKNHLDLAPPEFRSA